MTTAELWTKRYRAEWKHVQSVQCKNGSNNERKFISSQSPMEEGLEFSKDPPNKCTTKRRRPITVAARHRLPEPISSTRKTAAYASGTRIRWTRSLEYSTTSRHGPRYLPRSCMPPVYNIHVIPTCAGCYTHEECPKTLPCPTALYRLIRKPTATGHRPCVLQDAPE